MLVLVNQCDNKSSVIVYSKYGPRGYKKLEYSIDKQGLRKGNFVSIHMGFGLIYHTIYTVNNK